MDELLIYDDCGIEFPIMDVFQTPEAVLTACQHCGRIFLLKEVTRERLEHICKGCGLITRVPGSE